MTPDKAAQPEPVSGNAAAPVGVRRYHVGLVYDEQGRCVQDVEGWTPGPGKVYEHFRHAVLATDYDALQADLTAEREKVAEAERETDLAFQMLEANGVSRERAKRVSNGIDVLVTRMARESAGLEQSLAEAQRREAELVATAERVVNNCATIPGDVCGGAMDPVNSLYTVSARAIEALRAILKGASRE